MLSRIFDGAVEQVTRGIAHATRRHEVLARNVANLATPSYRARDLAFDDHLQPLLQPAAGAEADGLRPVGPQARRARLVLAGDGPPRTDGNDVQLDRQMARLAENTLLHNALTQILAGRFAALRAAISGRL